MEHGNAAEVLLGNPQACRMTSLLFLGCFVFCGALISAPPSAQFGVIRHPLDCALLCPCKQWTFDEPKFFPHYLEQPQVIAISEHVRSL